jgi:hypothetical protein
MRHANTAIQPHEKRMGLTQYAAGALSQSDGLMMDFAKPKRLSLQTLG